MGLVIILFRRDLLRGERVKRIMETFRQHGATSLEMAITLKVEG
jgi:hypothetical protein